MNEIAHSSVWANYTHTQQSGMISSAVGKKSSVWGWVYVTPMCSGTCILHQMSPLLNGGKKTSIPSTLFYSLSYKLLLGFALASSTWFISESPTWWCVQLIGLRTHFEAHGPARPSVPFHILTNLLPPPPPPFNQFIAPNFRLVPELNRKILFYYFFYFISSIFLRMWLI